MLLLFDAVCFATSKRPPGVSSQALHQLLGVGQLVTTDIALASLGNLSVKTAALTTPCDSVVWHQMLPWCGCFSAITLEIGGSFSINALISPKDLFEVTNVTDREVLEPRLPYAKLAVAVLDLFAVVTFLFSLLCK